MKAVIKLSSMGDIIHSLITLPKLNEKIDFIVDSSFKEIVENNPYINNIIDIPLRKAKREKKEFFKIYKNLRKYKFDEVYDLQGLLKSAIVGKIISKNLIGFKNPREKIASFFYNKKVLSNKKYAVERYLELFGFEDKEFLINHPKLLFYKDRNFSFLSNTRKNIVFIIGASWECKKAPLSVWKKLANYLVNENIIIPVATDDEERDAKQISEINPDVKIVRLNLNDLKALIDKSDLLIGNDTGPSFIAWANNINNIILYGCTYNNKILENKFSKSIEVQKSKIDKKLNNFENIDVKKIIKAIDEF
jgi:heptosyltransferase-1